MSFLSAFDGTVVKLAEYGPGKEGGHKLISHTQILTPNGTIDVDMTDFWYPEVKIGDHVECEVGGGWFYNGRLVSAPDEDVTINGILYKPGPL